MPSSGLKRLVGVEFDGEELIGEQAQVEAPFHLARLIDDPAIVHMRF